MEIGAFIDMSNRAETPGELFTQFRGAMAARGFDRILFALMTDHVTINRPAQHGFMCNYPLDWIKFYLERRYEAVDPVRQYLYLAETAFTWESMPHRLQRTKPQRECLSQARAAGLQDGIGVPLRGPAGALAGIGAASSKGGADVQDGSLSRISLLSQHFYAAFLKLEGRQRQPQPRMISLTEREQQVLKWCAAGRTKQQAGAALGITESAVKFHINSIQKKLGAGNMAAAVQLSLRLGLIQI